jgi:hypothetical protein
MARGERARAAGDRAGKGLRHRRRKRGRERPEAAGMAGRMRAKGGVAERAEIDRRRDPLLMGEPEVPHNRASPGIPGVTRKGDATNRAAQVIRRCREANRQNSVSKRETGACGGGSSRHQGGAIGRGCGSGSNRGRSGWSDARAANTTADAFATGRAGRLRRGGRGARRSRAR